MEIAVREYTTYHSNEILTLYESVEWKAYTANPEKLLRAFASSLISLAAYDADRLVGILRAVGDGETLLFIQDLLVHPDYQRKGIGSTLIQSLLNHFPDIRQIHLVTDNSPETLAFYNSQGFVSLEQCNCIAMTLSH